MPASSILPAISKFGFSQLCLVPGFPVAQLDAVTKEAKMKVGVLGSGTVGQTLAAGFLKDGHQVVVGTRDPGAEDLRSFRAKTSGLKVGAFPEAAKFGEMLVLSVLARAVEDVIDLPRNKFRDS